MKKCTKRALLSTGLALAATGMALATSKQLKKENKDIQTTEYIFRSLEVPEGFHGFRIVNVSDLQSEYFGEDQKELLAQVEAARPDIIVMTGDLVDRNKRNFMASIKAVKGLLKLAPVYYVNGNHEMRISETKMLPFYAELRQLGVKVLFDEGAMVVRKTDHIKLVGLSEYSVFAARSMAEEYGKEEEYKALAAKLESLSSREDDGFTVLLAHEPQYLHEYAMTEADLVLCGHAHGGQFRLPNGQGLFAPNQGVLPQYTEGYYYCNQTTMLVSRGLGNSTFPFRLNNKPEILAITLEHGETPAE